MTVKEKILKLFEGYNEMTVKEIVDLTMASKQMVHLVMNELLENKVVEKLGRTPKTVYRLCDQQNEIHESEEISNISKEAIKYLRENFILITETGTLLNDIEAFSYWCQKRSLPLQKTLTEYIQTKNKYYKYLNKEGFINGIEKIRNTKAYDKIWLDQLFYVDFYAIERFGKTKLGTLLHFAKQGQNKFLMRIIMEEIKENIIGFINKNKFDVIGFVPATIRREVQFMKFLQSNLNISLPVIEIKKISGIIPVPQKSLSKIEDRINNAEKTFAVTDNRKFKSLLLIDDAVGSGSTLNQIAGKIKRKNITQKVTGLGIVGSFKGFDVISGV